MEKDHISIYLKPEFAKALKLRSLFENRSVNDFALEALEKQYLHPFLSKRHLRNYQFLQGNFGIDKDISKHRQVLFYILAYDGIYMEYIYDIYKVEKDKEFVRIPKELNDILHPGFCLIDAACEFFTKGEITDLHGTFKWLKFDNNETIITLNSIMLMKDVLDINENLYLSKAFEVNSGVELNRTFSLNEYINSNNFKLFSGKMQLLIKELFQQMMQNNIDVDISPCSKDELTFSLITNNDKRLALVSSSDDGTNLRIGINRWKNAMHGNMLYCYDIEDIPAVVKDSNIPDSDLLTKYNELI
jgi:hypothetical protein